MGDVADPMFDKSSSEDTTLDTTLDRDEPPSSVVAKLSLRKGRGSVFI